MTRRLIAATAAAAIVPAAVLAVSTSAAGQCKGGCNDGDITVRVSDSTPASGQQFVVRGMMVMGGLPAPSHVVKVQTYLGGSWQQIRGAKVTTNSHGQYRVRLILQTTGQRSLRVVGVGQGDESNEAERFSVRVH